MEGRAVIQNFERGPPFSGFRGDYLNVKVYDI
jgi:hypothetical protein